MTVFPITTVAVSPEAWPFVWAVLLVLLLLLLFAAMLIGHRRRIDRRPTIDREAVDLQSDGIEQSAGEQSLFSKPDEQTPTPSMELGEERLPAIPAVEAAGLRGESTGGEQVDLTVSRQDGAAQSDSPPMPSSQVSETVVDEPLNADAREDAPKGTVREPIRVEIEPHQLTRMSRGTSVIKRFQRRPSRGVAAALGVAIVGRYLIRRR